MNVTNNRRRQESCRRIEKAFEALLQKKALNEIRVTEICEMAGLNRTTFYAIYEDVYALSEAFQDSLLDRLMQQYQQEWEARRSSFDFIKLFRHIRENREDYLAYMKLNPQGSFRWMLYDEALAERMFSQEHLKYHIAFFGNGLNAIIRLWLAGDCAESPEEMAGMLKAEYRNIDIRQMME